MLVIIINKKKRKKYADKSREDEWLVGLAVEVGIALFHLDQQGSKFIFGLGRTCATRCTFLGALAKF